MSMDLQRFHATFFEESREGLDAMEAGLLALESGQQDAEIINSVFRAAHSIKGGAGTFGFDAIAALTHVLETLLDELRAGKRALEPVAVDAMLSSVDVLRALLREAEHGQPADPQAVAAVKARLEAVLSGTAASAAAPAAAKGLEFPVVFLTGMEDGNFPHLRSLQEPKELAEERRLAYVGLTRAEQRLYITRAAIRSAWGQPSYNPPSRFLNEIPADLITWRRSESTQMRSSSSPAVARLAQRPGGRSPGNRPLIDLSSGDRVTHDAFGMGKVVEVVGEGEKMVAHIDFGGEVKRLLLRYAPVTKL